MKRKIISKIRLPDDSNTEGDLVDDIKNKFRNFLRKRSIQTPIKRVENKDSEQINNRDSSLLEDIGVIKKDSFQILLDKIEIQDKGEGL